MKSNPVRTFSSNRALVKKQRRRIMECAKGMFYEKGYHKTSMRDIAKASGLTTGTIYHYIGSKEDILHLIAKSAGDKAFTLRRYSSKLPNMSIVELLRKCMNKYVAIVDFDMDTYLFLNREIISFAKMDRDYLLKTQVNYVEFFDGLLKKGIESGEFKVHDTVLIAHNILMVGQDWMMRRWFLKRKYTLEEYTRLQTEFIIDAIRQN